MIISQTPYRISLFGGGTDYPAWYRENGGSVLTTTINKYCYISCRILPPFFDHKHRIVYSNIESVKEFSEIKHPAVRAILTYMGVQEGLEIHHDGDLPARSGIGSSSSFSVGLLKTLYAHKGKIISKNDLARLAIHIEQNVIKETVGSQDQIAAAYGGIMHIEFKTDGNFIVNPVILPRSRIDELNSRLMLFFTGFPRTAEMIAKSKVENFKEKRQQILTMGSFVDEGLSILQNQSRDLNEIGSLLHENWKLKRELSTQVTNDKINEIYQAGLDAGAKGGKVLGAGGGGFVLFFAAPETQEKIRERLKHLTEVNFKFEFSGSRIALYDPNFGINPASSDQPLQENLYQ